MQKEIAAEVLALMLEYSGKLDQSVQRVKDSCTEQEFVAYRKAVATIMGGMYVDIMWPIFTEHPELEPEEMKPRNKPAEQTCESTTTRSTPTGHPIRKKSRSVKKPKPSS